MKLLNFGRAVHTATAIILLLGIISFSARAANAEQRLTKVADGVYSYVEATNASPQNSFGANAGVVVGEDGVVVIDTLTSAKEAKRFIKDIRSITDKPIKYVVNTHAHLDHTFGNSEFEKLGAVIISQSIDARQMRASSEAVLQGAAAYGLTEKDMEGTRIAYPSLTFSKEVGIALGDEKLELIYPGASHTKGSIMVFLPGMKLLFAGDILFANYHPFIADGDIDSWVGVLDKIMAMDVTTIIPGHGPVSGKKDIRDMRAYLLAFDQNAKVLCAESNDLDWIVSEIRKVLPPRPEGESLIKANIQMKYLKKGSLED
jgi:cyclase